MAKPSTTNKPSALLAEFHIPLLIVGAFCLGAGGMWLIMRTSSSPPPPARKAEMSVPPATGADLSPPNVSNLPPADAELTLANWNYDRQNWPHAIQHYQQAIARGADNPDVRTDLGNCFRFSGEPQKALEQYKTAQTQNPMHENSLFNQAGLFAEVLHDHEQGLAIAREFLKRFPQSPRAESARQLIARIQSDKNANIAP
jgi:tetratricopeptide (TPR) repeat protein